MVRNSTDKILQQLESERVSRQNLTKEDLQRAYEDLERLNFPTDGIIKFSADLSGSKEIAYHYRLICEDWEKDRGLYLENSFDKHGSEGIEFLFS